MTAAACVRQDFQSVAWGFPAVLVTFGQMGSCYCYGGFPQRCNTVGSSLFFLFWLSTGAPKPYIPLDISGVVLEEISRS